MLDTDKVLEELKADAIKLTKDDSPATIWSRLQLRMMSTPVKTLEDVRYWLDLLIKITYDNFLQVFPEFVTPTCHEDILSFRTSWREAAGIPQCKKMNEGQRTALRRLGELYDFQDTLEELVKRQVRIFDFSEHHRYPWWILEYGQTYIKDKFNSQ